MDFFSYLIEIENVELLLLCLETFIDPYHAVEYVYLAEILPVSR